jgi:hypothetical protein
VGKHRLVPIALLAQQDPAYLVQRRTEEIRSSEKTHSLPKIDPFLANRPRLATAIFWLVTALSISLALISRWPSSLNAGYVAVFRLNSPTPSPQRLGALSVFWASLLSLYSVVAGILLVPRLAACAACNPPIIFKLSNMRWETLWLIIALAATVVVTGWIWQRAIRQHVVSLYRVLALLFPIILIAAYTLHFPVNEKLQDPYLDATKIFGAMRYTDLDSGVSPFLPLVLLAFALLLWSLSSLRRTSMLEAMAGGGYPANFPGRSFLGFARSGSLDLATQGNRIRLLLSRSPLGPAALVIALFAAATIASVLFRFDFSSFNFRHPASFFGALRQSRPVPSIEGSEFDWLLQVSS